MKLYMNKELYSAEAEYNVEEKVFIVLRGSTVSPKVENNIEDTGNHNFIKCPRCKNLISF